MTTTIRNSLIALLALGVLVACGTEPPVTPTVVLTVDVDGLGSGVVTSSTGGINTGTGTTTASLAVGTEVALTATPASGSTFAGWAVSGAAECEAGTADTVCELTVEAATTVTATFDLIDVTPGTLTVSVIPTGIGEGNVTSDVGDIDCPDVLCEAEFAGGTVVTLTATATAGGFVGWSGDVCDGSVSPTCVVTISGDQSVSATFGDVITATSRVLVAGNSAEEFLENSSDDPVQWPTGFVRPTSSDLELTRDPDHAQQLVGLRFVDLDVPADAVLVSAFITFTAFESPFTGTTGDVELSITAQDSASPAIFTTADFGITSRTTVAASVDWTIQGEWVDTEQYQTVDVSPVLQQVLDLGDWAAGSDVVFLISSPTFAQTDYRRAVPHGESAGPLLTVTYSLP